MHAYMHTQNLKKVHAESEVAEFIRSCALVIDLDGKILSDISWIEDMDRLPVLVCRGCKDKLLGILKFTSGTECNEVKAVYEIMIC